MTATVEKLKILALHGYYQSDKTFSAKIGSLRKCLKKEVDFIFIRAPHKVPPLEDSNCDKEEITDSVQDSEQYGWWLKTTNVGLEDSIELVETTFKNDGPFDGIMGFSQGGSFLSILCAMQQKKILSAQFNFAVIIAGFESVLHKEYYDEKILLPTLHVYGETDQIIIAERSRQLSDLFINKKISTHEGGHYVPGKKHLYYDFIKEMLDRKMNKSIIC